MERVLGIGGAFIKAHDPATLSEWYRIHLGLPINDQWTGAIMPLHTPEDTAGAYVVWGAFDVATDYFGEPHNQCMINFRVRDLDAMLTQLRDAGCLVDAKVERSEFGAFGWVTDPEGNRVELWEPPTEPPPDA
jgi:predicted enzyme related to lactoylglutathione lyase